MAKKRGRPKGSKKRKRRKPKKTTSVKYRDIGEVIRERETEGKRNPEEIEIENKLILYYLENPTSTFKKAGEDLGIRPEKVSKRVKQLAKENYIFRKKYSKTPTKMAESVIPFNPKNPFDPSRIWVKKHGTKTRAVYAEDIRFVTKKLLKKYPNKPIKEIINKATEQVDSYFLDPEEGYPMIIRSSSSRRYKSGTPYYTAEQLLHQVKRTTAPVSYDPSYRYRENKKPKKSRG